MELGLTLPGEWLEAVARRVADILAERHGASSERVSPWLSTVGAADYLACSPARIHDLVQARALRPRRDGRRLLFKRSELDDYLEGSSE